MINRDFIVTLVRTRKNQSFSMLVGVRHIVLTFLLISAIFFIINLGVVHVFRHYYQKTAYQILKERNQELKESLAAQSTIIQKMETDLKEFSEIYAYLNPSWKTESEGFQWGVGGPEKSIELPYEPFEEEKEVVEEVDLLKLETLLTNLKKQHEEVKATIQLRDKEIAHYPSIRPVREGWLSSKFGKRIDPFTEKLTNHPGIDICVPEGTPVYASAAGRVKSIRNRETGYGRFIIIDHGFGFETIYAHLSKVQVREGQIVKRWDIIGLSGNSGRSTAPHLHYGVYAENVAKDPMNFILE